MAGVAERASTQRRLAAALSLALLANSTMDLARASVPTAPAAAGTVPAGHIPQAPQNWPVQVCDDTTAVGSLRYIASHAMSGDTIDFSQLPATCGMNDSTITLTAGEIVLHQPDIKLVGPPPGSGTTVTLSGSGLFRVFRHQMYAPYSGTLRIEDLRIVDGYADSASSIGGGCVFSDANIELYRSLVAGCAVHSSTGNAYGGGLHTPHGKISLVSSKVSGNTVSADSNGNARGGGASSPTLSSKYSELVGNSARGYFAQGGGAAASTVSMAYSTVADNSADDSSGGIFISSANLDSAVVNSTFSGNHSHWIGGAIVASVHNLNLFNSTIASNSTDYDFGGGLYFKGVTANIQSTIIASNTSAAMASGTDLYIKSGTLTGAGNAVISSNDNPAGVIALTEDPQLAPLAWTGGRTRTMDLRSSSPAIGIGNNNSNRTFDQRGAEFPRETGQPPVADIGAVQSTDRIFVSDLDDFFL